MNELVIRLDDISLQEWNFSDLPENARPLDGPKLIKYREGINSERWRDLAIKRKAPILAAGYVCGENIRRFASEGTNANVTEAVQYYKLYH